MPLRLGLHLDDARVQQHRLHHLVDALREDVDEIAVGAGQQAAGVISTTVTALPSVAYTDPSSRPM